jgi:hypothetical protein
MCRIDRLFPATLVANTFVVRMTEPRPNFCIQSEFRDTNDWRARNGHHLPQIDTASNRLDVARSQNGYSDGPTKLGRRQIYQRARSPPPRRGMSIRSTAAKVCFTARTTSEARNLAVGASMSRAVNDLLE